MVVTENIVLIDLGRQGEKDVTTVPIDYSPWAVEYGQGAVQAVYSRADGLTYNVVLEVDGTTANWVVTKADTEIDGRGELQIEYYVGDKLKKSIVWATKVSRSLKVTGDAPDPYETWLESLQTLAAETQTNAQTAETKAGEASASAESAKESELEAQQSALEAKTSEANAKASEDNAKASEESAAESAERAEQSAAQSGYMFFYIDAGGWLHYVRTDNTQVDFYIGDDGYLYVEG